jgi:glycosyltransferase involved in cell wall biosynthesis
MIIPKPNLGDYPSAPVVLAVNQILAWGSDVIVVNGSEQDQLVQQMYRVPSDRVHYVPLIPRVSPLRWVAKKVAEEPALILFFGRVDRHKGVEYLVRAQPFITQHASGARFVIAGGGSEFARCRQLIQDPTRFELHEGFLPNEFVAELFQRASVVVLPYLSASTSAVLMTAQVFGKPVVATAVGSLPEYIQDGVTGLLVSPADSQQLAEAIVRLLTDETLRHQMGENAARQAQAGRKTVVERTLQALEKAILRHWNFKNSRKATADNCI